MPSPRFSDETADRILRRAVELADVRRASMTLSDIRDSAAQLGVAPEYVDLALEEALEGKLPPMGVNGAAPAGSQQRAAIRVRSWLSQLGLHTVVGIAAVPALLLASRISYALPVRYWDAAEGIVFGVLVALIARLVKAPFALLGACYLTLAHIAVFVVLLLSPRSFVFDSVAMNSSVIAAGLAGVVTALWFRTSRQLRTQRA